jgi:hypothetical protein
MLTSPKPISSTTTVEMGRGPADDRKPPTVPNQATTGSWSKAASTIDHSWWDRFCAILAKVSCTAWCCGGLFLFLFYRLLVRLFWVRAFIKRVHEEEVLVQSGIPRNMDPHHPALAAIRRWSFSPALPVERVYRWLDGQIATVFGSLISEGEALRSLSLNVSFGATIVAFVIATTGGHDIDRMLSEVSGALGATLLGLVLFTIETATIAKLNAESVRLEYDGREMIDLWAAQGIGQKARRPKAEGTDDSGPEEANANPS